MPASLMNVDWRKLPNAPPAGTPLCALQDLVPGVLREFTFEGLVETGSVFRLLVFRHNTGVHGYVNQCPHHWLPMNRSDGSFLKWSATELMCAHHSAVFNLLEGGACSLGPCLGSNLIRVPLKQSEGQISIAEELNPVAVPR